MKNQKLKIKNFTFWPLFAVCYLIFAVPALAQFELPNLNVRPVLNLSIEPITPIPDSTVTLTANISGITNVNNSTYNWFLNGVRQTDASGINKNTFTFQTGGLGTVYRIGVSVLTPDGENFSDSISVTVSDADLTWNANSEVPAAYQAKIFPSQNSIVSISAQPFVYRPGTRILIGPASLVYNWAIDDKFIPEKSGTNKPDYIFKVNDFAGTTKTVRVEIRTEDKSVSLSKEITIPIVRPQTLIYFSDTATNRPHGQALHDLTLGAVDSLNFSAKSYFFNAAPSKLKWRWSINGKEVPGTTEFPWLASLSVPKNVSRPFSMQIRLAIQNPEFELEAAETTINFRLQ